MNLTTTRTNSEHSMTCKAIQNKRGTKKMDRWAGHKWLCRFANEKNSHSGKNSRFPENTWWPFAAGNSFQKSRKKQNSKGGEEVTCCWKQRMQQFG